VWGSYLGDLLLLDTAAWRWREVALAPGAQPAKRAGHAAVVLPAAGGAGRAPCRGERMFVHGGLGATETSTVDASFLYDLDDVWYLCLPVAAGAAGGEGLARWVKVAATVSGGGAAPAGRRSHTLAPYLDDCFVLFGGYSRSAAKKNRNDVWLFNATAAEWTLLDAGDATTTETRKREPAAAAQARPLGRGGHAAFVRRRTGDLVVSNGAECLTGCTCLPDTWAFNIAARTWALTVTVPHRSVSPDGQPQRSGGATPSDAASPSDDAAYRPVARFMLGAATVRDDATGDDALAVFGGESYRPYAYWNDLWLLTAAADGAAEFDDDDRYDAERQHAHPNAVFADGDRFPADGIMFDVRRDDLHMSRHSVGRKLRRRGQRGGLESLLAPAAAVPVVVVVAAAMLLVVVGWRRAYGIKLPVSPKRRR
jgi:hypothetical protein